MAPPQKLECVHEVAHQHPDHPSGTLGPSAELQQDLFKSFHVYSFQGPINKVYGHVEGLLKKAKLNVYLLMHVTSYNILQCGKMDIL